MMNLKLKKGIHFFDLFMLGILVVFVLLSVDFAPTARLLPMMIGTASIIFLLLNILFIIFPDLRLARIYLKSQQSSVIQVKVKNKGEKENDCVKKPDKQHIKTGEYAGLVSIVALLILIFIIGFWGAIPLFLLSFLRFYAKEGWGIALSISISLVAFIYLVFVVVLGVEFYPGYIIHLMNI